MMRKELKNEELELVVGGDDSDAEKIFNNAVPEKVKETAGTIFYYLKTWIWD